MEVNCQDCAGCCLDWRPLSSGAVDHERRGPYRPLDDVYNLAPLTRDEIRTFLAQGYGDALLPRLFRADEGSSTTIDGVEVAAIDGHPAFFVGLRKPPKPVAPFESTPRWLPTCVFLDPETLQCRIHDDDLYPNTCASYPGENLVLGVESECERVERTTGTDRLLDDEPPDDVRPLLGPAAVGAKVFVHPRPDDVEPAIERLAAGESTREDQARFVAVAAASSPGTTAIDDEAYEQARETIRNARSWAGQAIEEWNERAADPSGDPPDPALGTVVEADRGAPPTPGWE